MRMKDVAPTLEFSCRAEDSLQVPAQLMWEQNVASVAVVDASGARLGLITERDLCVASYFTGLPLKAQTVAAALRQAQSCAHFLEAVSARSDFLRSDSNASARTVSAPGRPPDAEGVAVIIRQLH